MAMELPAATTFTSMMYLNQNKIFLFGCFCQLLGYSYERSNQYRKEIQFLCGRRLMAARCPVNHGVYP